MSLPSLIDVYNTPWVQDGIFCTGLPCCLESLPSFAILEDSVILSLNLDMSDEVLHPQGWRFAAIVASASLAAFITGFVRWRIVPLDKSTDATVLISSLG